MVKSCFPLRSKGDFYIIKVEFGKQVINLKNKPSFDRVQNGQIEFAKRCIGSKKEIRAIIWKYSIAQVRGERLGEKVTQYF